jgi:Ca2+-binding EF-hand superfamily protein
MQRSLIKPVMVQTLKRAKVLSSNVLEAEAQHNEWATRMWSRMDRDNNGSISRKELDCSEFRAILRRVLTPDTEHAEGGGAIYARAETNQEQALSLCLRKADVNDDGRLSFEEFKTFLWALRQDNSEKDTAALMFALFDLDTDGYISMDEFREIYRFYLGHEPTFAEFSGQWLNLSGDEDYISKERYARWLQTTATPLFRQRMPGVGTPPLASLATGSANARADGAGSFSPSASTMSFWEQSVQARKIATNAAGWPLAPKKDIRDRPKWNKAFNAGVNPNFERPARQRQYFSRTQSEPQLVEFYKTHTGFGKQLERMTMPLPKKKMRVLSTDTVEKSNEHRHECGGTMREHINGAPQGEVSLWEDNWQTPLRYKRRLRVTDRPLPYHAFFEASHEPIGPMARRINAKFA